MRNRTIHKIHNYHIFFSMEHKTPSLSAREVRQCRVCGNTELISVVDIGEQYLSSVFPEDLGYRATASRYPLKLALCRKKNDGASCGLLQLRHHLDLTPMYDAYPYTSATNSSMTQILRDVAESGRAVADLKPDDIILDIGGNETLLSFFKDEPYQLLNIDPAKNVVALVDSPRYRAVNAFFSEASFRSVSQKKAKLIFSIAMFYHLDNPMQFSREVAAVLDDDGVWIIQMAYLPAMIRTNMYDNIVHEHAGYYATQQVKWIMEKVGLEVFDVLENDVYGGSFRIFVKKKGSPRCVPTERLRTTLERELSEGIFEEATYRAFMQRIEKTREDLLALITRIKAEGKSIWIYGASTKGNTILQYCGLGNKEIDAAADSNAFKIGKYIIGSDIPIKDEAAMRAAKPNYLLALPYSFVDGFMKREAELIAHGTKFIVPLPEVKIV